MELLPVSEYHRLAALDLAGIQPEKITQNGRVWFHYDRAKAEELISKFESGQLQGCLRDYAAALGRVKTRIFENVRRGAEKHGANFESSHT